MNGDNSNSELD